MMTSFTKEKSQASFQNNNLAQHLGSGHQSERQTKEGENDFAIQSL
jgi:hypothetical protein